MNYVVKRFDSAWEPLAMQTPVIEFDYGDALNKARVAYQTLVLGGQVVRFRDQNGEMVEYGPGNLSKLSGWIAYLELKTGSIPNRGPLGVIF